MSVGKIIDNLQFDLDMDSAQCPPFTEATIWKIVGPTY